MAANLETTLVIEIATNVYLDHEWGPQDGSKPGVLRLTAPREILREVLKDALQALDGV